MCFDRSHTICAKYGNSDRYSRGQNDENEKTLTNFEFIEHKGLQETRVFMHFS